MRSAKNIFLVTPYHFDGNWSDPRKSLMVDEFFRQQQMVKWGLVGEFRFHTRQHFVAVGCKRIEFSYLACHAISIIILDLQFRHRLEKNKKNHQRAMKLDPIHLTQKCEMDFFFKLCWKLLCMFAQFSRSWKPLFYDGTIFYPSVKWWSQFSALVKHAFRSQEEEEVDERCLLT